MCSYARAKHLRKETMTRNSKSASWHRALLVLVIAGGMIWLQGCATNQQPLLHHVYYCNLDSAPVTQIEVNYGAASWVVQILAPGAMENGSTKCRGITSPAAQAVPESIRLRWIAGGRRHELAIPLKSRLNGTYPTKSIQLMFRNERVEVYEGFFPNNSQELRLRIYPAFAPGPLFVPPAAPKPGPDYRKTI